MRRTMPAYKMLCGAGFIVASALWLFPWIPESVEATWLLLIALFLVGLGPIAWELRCGALDLFNLKNSFIAYYLLQLGLFPACVLLGVANSNEYLYALGANNNLVYTAATEAALVGLIFFQVGYYLDLGSAIGNRLPSRPIWKWRRVSVVSGVFIALGLGAVAVFFGKYGGVTAFLSNLGEWRSLGLIGEGYLTFPMTFLLSAGVIVLFVKTVSLNPGRRFFIALLFILSTIPTILMGFRLNLVPLGLQFAAIWHYGFRRISLTRATLLGLLSLAFLTGYGLVRDNLENKGQEALRLDSISASEILQPVVFRSPGFEITQRVIYQEETVKDYQYWWKSLLEVVTILVPHAVWDGKPMPSGIEFGREFMSDYLWYRDGKVTDATGGFSPSAVGFFYWQMGLIGVVMGMFILGIGARASYAYLLVSPRDPSRILLYTTVLGMFAIFSESPQDGANGLFMRLIVVGAVLLFLTAGAGVGRSSNYQMRLVAHE